MKFFNKIQNNIFLVITLFLLAFIPLYPKIPLIDIKNTWVYIRAEDFVMAVVFLIFSVQLIRKKVTLKTPLTIPIIAFWIAGLISTLHGIIFIFPNIPDGYTDVAVLHYLRRIEYLGVFFIGYYALKNKFDLKYVIAILSASLIVVCLYGFGQKGFLIGFENRFPAFSTMNEEFAKGIPLRLSALARVSSTFAGHYDLAAYLVLIIPLMGSLAFGVKRLYGKLFFILLYVLGLLLLLMTNSRVSFAVYIVAIVFMLTIIKKKLFIIPVIILSVLISQSFDGITKRYQSTLTQADLVIDARTGKAIGIAKTVEKDGKKEVVIEDQQSTGENLPQGSGYLGNIPTDGNSQSVTKVTYKRSKLKEGKQTTEIKELEGEYIIKKVLAYDVSFTTRFQGTWPRAWNAFMRNILLGSGYSSISLASDGNYLRMLGETGILGLAAFIGIFLIFGIYVSKIIGNIDNKIHKHFALGITAGLFGVGMNAFLIDVFEASKVAFVMWLLVGVTISLLHSYKKENINYRKEIIGILSSVPAIAVYLVIICFSIFSMILGNFFVGDDFTWLRWAADCKKVLYASGQMKCEPYLNTIKEYFVNSEGFFYRPGTKTYFYFMYPWFSFSQGFYHAVSIFLHFGTVFAAFLLSRKIFNSKFYALIVSVVFLVLSINAEIIFWVSATGHLIAFFLILSSVLMFSYFRDFTDKKKYLFLISSILAAFSSVFFHEVGIIAPFLVIAFDQIFYKPGKNFIKNAIWYLMFILGIPAYLFIRFTSNTHWFNGDYSYNLYKLPLNFVGNSLGYLMASFFGSRSLSIVSDLRILFRENIMLSFAVLIFGGILFFVIAITAYRKVGENLRMVILLGAAFFIIPLLPFIGLGNISPRYVYLSSFGVVLILVALHRNMIEKFFKRNIFISYIVLSIAALVFGYYHYSELVRINKDWSHAGNVSQKFVYNMNETYVKVRNYSDNPVFYFINRPIRYGEAWIFPVGLDDAVWFNFQSAYLTVKFPESVKLAFEDAEGSGSAKIFEFDSKGDVTEILQLKQTETIKKP